MKRRLTKEAVFNVLLLFIFAGVFGTAFLGCKEKESAMENVPFTICTDDMLPTEMIDIISEKLKDPFFFTFANNTYLYIAKGYGEVGRTSHNISVDSLIKADDGIHIRTTLHTDTGSPGDSSISCNTFYPYVVIRCEKMDGPVICD